MSSTQGKIISPVGSLFEFYSINSIDAAKIVELFCFLEANFDENECLSKFAKSYCFLAMELLISFYQRYKAISESLSGRFRCTDPEAITSCSKLEMLNFVLVLMALNANCYIEYLFWLCSYGKFSPFDRYEFITFANLMNKLNSRTTIFAKAKIDIDLIKSDNYQNLELEQLKFFDLKFGGSICAAFSCIQKLIRDSSFGKTVWDKASTKVVTVLKSLNGKFSVTRISTSLFQLENHDFSFSFEKLSRKFMRRICRILKTLKQIFTSDYTPAKSFCCSITLLYASKRATVYPIAGIETQSSIHDLIDIATGTYEEVSKMLEDYGHDDT